MTNKTCKWPIGTPGHEDFKFCGKHAPEDDCPYCEHHTKKAYRYDYVSRRQKQELEKVKKLSKAA